MPAGCSPAILIAVPGACRDSFPFLWSPRSSVLLRLSGLWSLASLGTPCSGVAACVVARSLSLDPHACVISWSWNPLSSSFPPGLLHVRIACVLRPSSMLSMSSSFTLTLSKRLASLFCWFLWSFLLEVLLGVLLRLLLLERLELRVWLCLGGSSSELVSSLW